MKRSEIFFGILRIPVDFAAAVAALLAAYMLRRQEDFLPDIFKRPDLESFPLFNEYVFFSLGTAVFFLVLLALFRLYALKAADSFAVEIRKIIVAGIIWLMAMISYYFILREFPFSRLALFYSAFFLVLFVSFGRILIKISQRTLLARGIGNRRILFVGDNAITAELRRIFARSLAVSVLGVVKNYEELKHFATKGNPLEEVIQTYDDHAASQEIITFCREHHLQYHFVPDVLEMYRTNVEVSPVGGIPLISLKPTQLDGWGKVTKRVFDMAIGGGILIILSPVFLIIAISIKLDSRGTVFFRFLDDGSPAQRIGERGRPFSCLKFRTMHSGTHNLRYTDLADRNLRKGSPLVKIKNDPRITRVGKVLRRFSLDELPQLWNVLKGEMSLVGPRPHLPEEVQKYDRHHKFVLAIKPGITGLAQISGRSDLPFEEEVSLDTYYIENWSIWLDIKIILKTLLVFLRPYRE